jgi:hypothetical protein
VAHEVFLEHDARQQRAHGQHVQRDQHDLRAFVHVVHHVAAGAGLPWKVMNISRHE